MRLMSAMLAMSVGCAMAIKPVPPDWDSKSAPDCTDGFAPVGGDAIASAVAFGTGIAAHSASTSNADQITTTALTIGAVLAVSTAIGAYRVIRCRQAEAEWRDAEKHVHVAEPPPLPEPRVEPYYCSTSATQPRASLCTHDKLACDKARGVAIAVIEDLSACAPADAAICFDDGANGPRCAATLEACIAQRDAAMTADAPPPGGCSEVKAVARTY